MASLYQPSGLALSAKRLPDRVNKQVDRAAAAFFLLMLALGACALLVVIAVARGLDLSVASISTGYYLILLGCLLFVSARYRRPHDDPRMVASAHMLILLLGGGMAGGAICLIGQTFRMPFIDPLLLGIDRSLGIHVDAITRAIAAIPALPGILGLLYVSSFPLILVTALLFCWIGRTARAWELCDSFTLCLLVTALCSAVIPAIGAFPHLAIPADLQNALPPGSGTYHVAKLMELRQATSLVIDPLAMDGVATFPSFHTALAMMTAAAWRGIPRFGPMMMVWQGGVVVSTIPIAGHYVIDLVAGAALWFLVRIAWRRAVETNPRALPSRR